MFIVNYIDDNGKQHMAFVEWSKIKYLKARFDVISFEKMTW